MGGIAVEIKTYGQFSITVNDKPVAHRHTMLTRPWQMFLLLALNKGKTLSHNELIIKLWGERIFADNASARTVAAANNNLKNVALRLRKEVRELIGGGSDPLRCDSVGYRLSDEVALSAVDVLDFHALCDELSHWEKSDPTIILPLFYELLSVYRGELVCQPSSPQWLQNLAHTSAAQFTWTMTECFMMLWQNGMYSEITRLYQEIMKKQAPNNEMIYYNYHATEKLRIYPNVRNGVYGNDWNTDFNTPDYWNEREVLRFAQDARVHPLEKEKDADAIHRELLRELERSSAGNSAMVCSFGDIKRLCHRHPGEYTMLVFTFRQNGADNVPANAPMLLAAAAHCFEKIALRYLCGHDAIAPYSANQMVLMMPNRSAAYGKQLKERILTDFRVNFMSDEIHLEGDISELRPAVLRQAASLSEWSTASNLTL
jgi:hypothetical protein